MANSAIGLSHNNCKCFSYCVCVCVAMCGGRVSPGSGVSGEGAACRDGGMSDGGEDVVEECSGRAAGEHTACSDAERETTHTPQHSHTAHAGRHASGGERCAEHASAFIEESYKSMYKRTFTYFPECTAI